MSTVNDFVKMLTGTSLKGAVNPPSEISEERDARVASSRFARGNIALGVDNSFTTKQDLERERQEASEFKFR